MQKQRPAAIECTESEGDAIVLNDNRLRYLAFSANPAVLPALQQVDSYLSKPSFY
jgi:hypothetical protein